MWELERGKEWNPWQYIGRPVSALTSHSTIINDDKGWWAAYAVSSVISFSQTLRVIRFS